MKTNQFLQKTFFALVLICAFGIAIITSCKKDYIKPFAPTENAAETETISSATGDTIPPTVSFTFPKNNDTLFDSITIKIKATDASGVASVQCSVDGVSLGTKTVAPYNFGWNTRRVLNGTHKLTVKAVDVSGNSKTKSITVVTSNAVILPIEQEVVNLINNERINRAMNPLTVNSKLMQAARTHSADMAKNNFFNHIGSAGDTYSTRLKDVGYTWSFAQENICGGQMTAQKLFDAMMASSGQKAILIDPNMKEIGVGGGYSSATNSTFHWYWTINVAAP